MQLKQLGHSVDKVEFIVMGGTFMALPEEYRDYFIRNLHDALSGHTSNNVAESVRYALTLKPVTSTGPQWSNRLSFFIRRR